MSDANSQHEAFVRLFSRHEGSVRAFVTSLLPNWEGVDEVMQEASLVMWRKFDQFDPNKPDSSFLSWAFVIARYEVLMYRRKRATDRLVFSEDVYELLAAEASEFAEDHPHRRDALNRCLTRLEPAQRQLIHVVYADGVSIKEAASRVGRTPTGLYKAVARIRQTLLRCIELTISETRLKEGL
ncbi:sigma-70 family RNA polymerase sigma factor [Prosthecobacter sp.]|uniref:sigma-70 family RNA polymerase sigma factor n=1 Tax=Prosthecobacter sp. TaxID=1965333 RepID=UPI001D91241D|nr:sigma-70 family RNA polymerase sigma factor [Prosthecobacter sp.]MCB1275204.1 sigma-70 family RNA polymerase sigma factor [Prosthecobacter sp.]